MYVMRCRKNIRSTQVLEKKGTEPPRAGEKALHLLLPTKGRTTGIDKLNVEFRRVSQKFGTRFARWWYRLQALRVLLKYGLKIIFLLKVIHWLA